MSPTRFTRTLLSRLLLATSLCGGLMSVARCEDSAEVKKNWRPYHEGPLQLDDFQGALPQGTDAEKFSGMNARTTANLHHDTKYTITKTPRSVEVKLTQITFENYFDRRRSWKRPGMSPALLDHEQGHFDLSEIYTRRARLLMADQMTKRKSIRVTRRTKKEAIAALHKEINDLLEPLYRDMHQAHLDYDKATSHGEVRDKQQTSREQQLNELKSLKSDQKLDRTPR